MRARKGGEEHRACAARDMPALWAERASSAKAEAQDARRRMLTDGEKGGEKGMVKGGEGQRIRRETGGAGSMRGRRRTLLQLQISVMCSSRCRLLVALLRLMQQQLSVKRLQLPKPRNSCERACSSR